MEANLSKPGLTVYFNYLSYYSQLARIVVHNELTDYDVEEKLVKLEAMEHLTSHFARHINPNFTVPALVTDGYHLQDSRDIINWAQKRRFEKQSTKQKTQQIENEVLDQIYSVPIGRLAFDSGCYYSFFFKKMNQFINSSGINLLRTEKTKNPDLESVFDKAIKSREANYSSSLEQKEENYRKGVAKVAPVLKFLETRLNSNTWLTGEKFSSTDGVAAIFLQWIIWIDSYHCLGINIPQVLLKFLERVKEDKVSSRAWKKVAPQFVVDGIIKIMLWKFLGILVPLVILGIGITLRWCNVI
eukprot:TRINITY_DN1335_c0_g1_i1.p1 TRINITY_DN1335_c0_g1~~TRINITY_DN1335_c0_g1_i1.p1  ORF type:complete len:350 (-),score=66.11 TRINITY_DN1335_c0_g1_i1:78-977(-)